MGKLDTQKTKNIFSVILFQNSKPPEFYRFSKSNWKKVIMGLPILVFILSGILFYLIYNFNKIRVLSEAKVPIVIEKLKKEITALESNLVDQKKLTASLEEKLSRPVLPEKFASIWPFLPTSGSEDETSSSIISTDQYQIEFGTEETQFKFNIVNQTPGNLKVAGFLFVLMKTKGQLHFFPSNSFSNKKFELNYTNGESFVTSRFRPVEANFPQFDKNGSYHFKVIIFSRDGDLLLKKEISYPKELKNDS